MFKRLLLEAPTALAVTIAFVTAATIFLASTWRAFRMPRAQADRFAQLPFESGSSDLHHDRSV